MRSATAGAPILAAWVLAACAGATAAGDKGGFVALDAAPSRFHPPARKLVVAMGVADYGVDGGWHDLEFPAADARAVASTLQELGGFEVADLRTGTVRREEMVAALDRLGTLSRDPSDVVVVYVSGHGTLARDREGRLRRYLVSSDSNLADVPGTALPVAELQARFDRLASRRKVLMLASCHAGDGKSQLPEQLVAELRTYKSAFFPPPLEGASRASFVIGASGWGEAAREDPNLGHDVYTYYLLEAIRRPYDPDGDGAVTVTEAHDYARRLTWRHSGGTQRPTLRSDILGGDPIVLAGTPGSPALPLLLSFDAALDGHVLRVDGADKGALPGAVAVAAGAHTVSVVSPSGRVVATRAMDLSASQRVVVEELLSAPGSATRPGWAVSGGAVYQFFLDSRSRAGLVEPGLLARVGASRAGLLGGRVRALGELQLTPGASARHAELSTPGGDVARVPTEVMQLGAGVGAMVALSEGERVTLELGPVLAATWFSRRFDVSGLAEDESWFTLVPSLAVAVHLRLWRDLSATLGARQSYVAFRVDGATRHLGQAQGSAGLSWAF